MPAYNAENYISDAIDSVIAQTYHNWELIIVDDGSTDNTSQIVKECQAKDNRIQYYYQQNGKQGKARNLGISKSNGVYLAFLDADDIWLAEKLNIQIDEIQNKGVDLVFADSYIFSHDEILSSCQKMNIPAKVFYDRSCVKLFLEGNKIPILTVLVKKEKVLAVDVFSEKLEIQNVEDYHLWLKLLMSNCKFYTSHHILAKYRIHSSSATSSDKLVLDKIPNVFYDLLQLYPIYKDELEKELKFKLKLFYKKNLFSKQELAFWIKKNTLYLSKSSMKYFYLFLNFLLPTKITKRVLIYILNA